MTINLVEIVRLKYPGEIEADRISFRMPGQYILIDRWEVSGVEKPSESSLLAEKSSWEPTFKMNSLQDMGKKLIDYLFQETLKLKGYDSVLSCVSYESSTNVGWQAESRSFIAWRDKVYAHVYSLYESIRLGQKPIPTEAEFLADLPVMVWP